MRKTIKAVAATAFIFLFFSASPADATRCEDGTYSTSTGSGTCSWHGGIDDGIPSINSGGGYDSDSNKSGIYTTGSTYSEPKDEGNFVIGNQDILVFLGIVAVLYYAVARFLGFF